jgi:membrane protein DedA with SNARE-associated domain
MTSLLAGLTVFITGFIDWIGYPGLFLMMFVEGVITPIPSEIIMPFAGYLASIGRFDPVLVIIVGTLGATAGSTVAYYIGSLVGRPFIFRYGRYFRITEDHMARAEDWFERYGNLSIFIGHSLPGTRSFISFPAGIAKMKLSAFILFTFLGAAVWNTVLTVAGYLLGAAWVNLVDTFEFADILVLGAVVALLAVYFLWWRRR